MLFSHNKDYKETSNLPNAFLVLTTDGNFAITLYKVFVRLKDCSKTVRLEQLDVIPNIHTGTFDSPQNTSSN